MRGLCAPVVYDGERFLAGGATVLVDGAHIVGVEPFGCDVSDSCEVETFDGTILPGLIDAHVHLVSSAEIGSLERASTLADEELDEIIAGSLRQQAAAGVTSVRDLGDVGFRTLAHRDAARPGAPRIVAAGTPLTIPGGHCHFLGGVVEGPGAIARSVAEHRERGVDVIKVMASGGMLTPDTDVMGVQFSRDELRLLVDTAHSAGLGVLAHAHSLAGIEHALDAGVDGIEHFTGLTGKGVKIPSKLLDRVAAAGVAVDPTMGLNLEVLHALPEPPPQIQSVMERLGLDIATFFASRLVQVGRMRAHGVRIVSGVDAGAAPPKAHGNQWRAVTDLVEAGYPVAEALATATAIAADECGLSGVTGRLRAGLDADLLVVDGDLRSDPTALGRPSFVLVRGAQPLA